jgi:hypothetical protein
MSGIDKGANWWIEQCYRLSLDYAKKNRGDLVPLIECWFIAPRLECEDGFSMSIQASSKHYCSPREDHSYPYKEVEVGYPSMEEACLLPYAEHEDDPTGTIYVDVPIELVDKLIEKHGGIAIEPYDPYEGRYSIDIEGERL